MTLQPPGFEGWSDMTAKLIHGGRLQCLSTLSRRCPARWQGTSPAQSSPRTLWQRGGGEITCWHARQNIAETHVLTSSHARVCVFQTSEFFFRIPPFVQIFKILFEGFYSPESDPPHKIMLYCFITQPSWDSDFRLTNMVRLKRFVLAVYQ